jgi:hypothetical protein
LEGAPRGPGLAARTFLLAAARPGAIMPRLEALKVVAGTVVVVGVLTIRWMHVGWEARTRERWGRGARGDVWTVIGGLYGGLLGFGLGWLVTDSVPVGLITAAAGAALLGWRHRVVTSILAAADADARPEPRLEPARVKRTPITFALAGAFLRPRCGRYRRDAVRPAWRCARCEDRGSIGLPGLAVRPALESLAGLTR